jgi:small-conductance mechanosensitive channel
MAGLDFDRQAFVTPSAPQDRSYLQLISPLLLVVALALVGYVGYKVYLAKEASDSTAAANEQIQQLQRQLAEMQKRLDTFEKHRKGTVGETSPVPDPAANQAAATAPPPSRTIYRIATASAQPAQPKTSAAAPPQSASAPTAGVPSSPEIAGEVAANHEAWEATTNRIADVVGVVGTQQGEISATRDALNQLLSQSHRQAVSFELGRGRSRTSVGPVILQLKSADSRNQHYSLCVYFSDQKCIELKDRALNEVVVFVVAKNSPPLELVATKIQRDQIVGYLEVPSGLQ